MNLSAPVIIIVIVVVIVVVIAYSCKRKHHFTILGLLNNFYRSVTA